MFHDMMDGRGGGYGYGYDAWAVILMLLWLALIIFVVILAVRYLSHGGYRTGGREDAVTILKRRYASGEIDKKEYQEKLKDLKS